MTRIKQNFESRGSLKCIQELINKNPKSLNILIAKKIKDLADEEITWVSPLESDEYAEYRDNSFIEKIGLNPLEINLGKFWPKNGPQWDALAKTKSGKVILIEAKANTSEIVSPGTKATGISKKRIDESLKELKEFLEVINDVDWSKKYYQYSNRLSHLFYLRNQCKV